MATYAGIALLSAATLLLELTLLRLFAVQQFYHFAFMAISLALLGSGASGTLLSIVRRRISPALLCLAFGASTIAAYLLINTLPFDSFSIAWERRQALYLAVYFLAVTLPFLFSGLVVGGELISAGKEASRGSHRVYGANLIGSALGCLVSLSLLGLFGGEGTLVFAAVLGAVASLLFIAGAGAYRTVIAASSGLLTLLGVLAIAFPPPFLEQNLSPYKTLSVLTQVADAEHTLTRWDATARVDVIESGSIHVMPGLSLQAGAQLPSQAGLLIDGDNLMPITGLAPEAAEAKLLADAVPGGLAYRLRPGARTLVLEAGTGLDVLFAVASGAPEVTAVEERHLVLEALQEEYREFTGGLYHHQRVTVENRSARVFARSWPGPGFELVILALQSPHRPVTSGAFSLTEDYRYTVEAFRDYLALLEEDGVLVVTRWLQTPASESAKVFAALAEALERNGRQAEEHLIAYRSLRTMTVMVAPRPFAAEEIEIVRTFLQERAYDAVFYPGLRPEELNRFLLLPEPTYHNLFQAILDDAAATYRSYPFDIRPPTDNHPFFHHFFKWRQTPEILAALGRVWQPFGGSGYFVLVALLLLVLLASAAFILAPLVFVTLIRDRHRERPRVSAGAGGLSRWRVLTYFACLGLAFLFVEMPLAQRFILLLEQPVTALAVVLFAILVFSGLGSLAAPRIPLVLGLALLVVVTVLYPLVLEPLSAVLLRSSETVRIGATISLLAPLGFLMGQPFAGGLRVLERLRPELVPWAWAINGSFSVISAVLAVMLALTWGFTVVLWFGAGAYALALVVFWRM
jgi:hypothetical protein